VSNSIAATATFMPFQVAHFEWHPCKISINILLSQEDFFSRSFLTNWQRRRTACQGSHGFEGHFEKTF